MCLEHTSCDSHKWKASPKDRKRRNISTCPFCLVIQGKGRGYSDLHLCPCVLENKLAEKSPLFRFSRPNEFKQIDRRIHQDENLLNRLTSRSNKILSWTHICECGSEHNWKMTVDRWTHAGCPRCATGTKDALICACKSILAIPELRDSFDYEKNIGIDPATIHKGSATSIWWKCPDHKTCNGHFWKTTVDARVRRLDNKCPFCAHHPPCECDSAARNSLLMSFWDSKSNEIDKRYPQIKELVIDENGVPVLKKRTKTSKDIDDLCKVLQESKKLLK